MFFQKQVWRHTFCHTLALIAYTVASIYNLQVYKKWPLGFLKFEVPNEFTFSKKFATLTHENNLRSMSNSAAGEKTPKSLSNIIKMTYATHPIVNVRMCIGPVDTKFWLKKRVRIFII